MDTDAEGTSRGPTPARRGINAMFAVALVFLLGWLFVPQIETMPEWAPVVIAASWFVMVAVVNVYER